MLIRPAFPILLATLALVGAAALAQTAVPTDDIAETRRALRQAQTDGEVAHSRAERLEAEAATATAQAERTARQQAAIAARIQQTEASMTGHEARARLIARERRTLARRLAARQQPLIRLTAALQRLSRRPAALALFRPGSIRDTMRMRALLDTILPVVEQRTTALRQEIARGKALENASRSAANQLRQSGARLKAQRQSLLALETRQRLDSRDATGAADRESERALALAEQAQDLSALADDLGKAGALREHLARLPGPILRPAQPAAAAYAQAESALPLPMSGPKQYILPVAGRLVAGFGAPAPNRALSRGLMLVPRAGAQVIAPGAGRVAFAGPFRGYGRIVIIEHGGDWTTLVTGMAELDTRVGAVLVAGSPLGLAGTGSSLVTLELRHGGKPVNPLEFIGQP